MYTSRSCVYIGFGYFFTTGQGKIDLMSYNEAETRYHLIDPVLRGKGYDDASKLKLETPAPVEAIGHKGRRRAGGGRTDYLLCVQTPSYPAPLPVGVLEAKKEDADPLKGMQQAKGYAECSRFHVQYVFATNGHLYGEYDKTSGLQSGPHPFSEHFPSHAGLTRRYADDTGIAIDRPETALLFAADSAAYPKKRYYQDAAIRACFEKILRCEQLRQPCRVLLALATGAGKTVLAANLLWRLNEAQRLPKPALFLCDRDELREQAYNKLSAAFGDSVRIVANSKGQNAAKNARVHIATYQTLGLDDEDADTVSFLSEHYPPDSFSVIIIDECHRSAWGRWSEVLLRNPSATRQRAARQAAATLQAGIRRHGVLQPDAYPDRVDCLCRSQRSTRHHQPGLCRLARQNRKSRLPLVLLLAALALWRAMHQLAGARRGARTHAVQPAGRRRDPAAALPGTAQGVESPGSIATDQSRRSAATGRPQ